MLQRTRILGNERQDLPDYNRIEDFACATHKAIFKYAWTSNNFVVNGFAATGTGTSTLSIALAGSVATFGADDGTTYIGSPTLSALTTTALTAGSTNYVEILIDLDTGGSDSRAFWDQTAAGGAGGEFSQIIDTFIFQEATLAINTSSFTGDPDKLPICEVDVNGGGVITEIRDGRDLFWRLGRASDTTFSFAWASRTEPANTQFTGADKDIETLKEFVDAVLTTFKELKGTTYWFETTSISVIDSFQNAALSVLSATTSSSKFSWDGSNLEITDDSGTPADADVIAYIRLFGSSATLSLTREDSSAGTPIAIADGEVLWVELPDPLANTTYDGTGVTSTDYRVSSRASVPVADTTFWLAYREGSNLYIRGLGELEPNEIAEISDNINENILNIIGVTSEVSDPVYSSVLVVTQNTDLVSAIGELDAELGPLIDRVNEDRNIKLIDGGTWDWDLGTTTLTWDADAYIQFPGFDDDRNTIQAGNVSLAANEVAYVSLNRTTDSTTNLTVNTANINALVLTNDIVIFARRDGNDVIVGTHSFRLTDGESKPLDAGQSDQALTFTGQSTRADGSPTYSSDIRGTAAESLEARAGALSNNQGDYQEDRSAYWRSDDEVTWTGTELQFTADIILEILNTKDGTITRHTIQAADSPVAIADGEDIYVAIDRTQTSENLTLVNSGTTPIPAQTQANKDVFVVCRRVDANGLAYLHIPFHKQVLDPGQSVRLGASGSGSGSGGIDWLEGDGLFEAIVGDWVAYADAAGTAPVDGTGGSPTVTITRTDTNPLEGVGSGLITKDAANRQGEGVSIDFTIDAGYRNQINEIDILFESSANYTGSSGTEYLTAWIYDVDNSNLIPTSNINLPFGSGRTKLIFPATDSENYRLIYHVSGTGTSAWTYKFETRVSPQSLVVASPAMTFLGSFTPTSATTNTNATHTGRLFRNGENLAVEIITTFSGNNAEGLVTYAFPSGYTIDSGKLDSNIFPIAGTDYYIPRDFNVQGLNASANLFHYGGIRLQASDGRIELLEWDPTSSSLINGGLWDGSANVPFTTQFENGDTIRTFFEVPVTEFADPTVYAESRVEYASNFDNTDASDTTSFSNSPSGELIPQAARTAARTKRIRFKNPILETDTIQFQVRNADGMWVVLNSTSILGTNSYDPYHEQNAAFYGMAGLYRVSGSNTDIDIAFGQYRRSTGATFGAAGAAWSADASVRWRVAKYTGAVPVDVTNRVSQIRLAGGNGLGGSSSGDTEIRNFSSVTENIGTGITYNAQTATTADSFTINEDGLYNIVYADESSGANDLMAITLNDTETSTAINSMTNYTTEVISVGLSSSASDSDSCSVSLYLRRGDIIRAKYTGTPDNVKVFFSICKIGP